MFKKLFLLTIASFICLSNINAQFNKAEIKFLNTQFKIQMNGDALSGVRVDGKANTYGLPSIKDFMKKFNGTKEELLALIGNETYLTAEEALEKGFYDEVIEASEDDPLYRLHGSRRKPTVEDICIQGCRWRNI